MKMLSKIFTLLFFLAAIPVWADIYFPTVTKVYFEKDNKPYPLPVDFTVTCFGYWIKPGPEVSMPRKKVGTYTPENVYSFSAKCPNYGCEIHETYSLNYRYVDYCNLEGKSGGRDFKIEKYADSPIDFSTCTAAKGNKFMRACKLKFSIPKDF